MCQFPEYVPPSASQATTRHCVWNSNENSVTSSQQYRHLSRNFEELTHTVTMPWRSLLAWLHHEIPILGRQKYDTYATFSPKYVITACTFLLKSIQKSAPSSNSSLKVPLHNAAGNGEHRCVIGCLSPEEIDAKPKYYDTWCWRYQKSYLTFFSRSNSGVTWQTFGSHASRPPVNNLSFCSRRGCCVLPTQPTGPKNASFDQIYALTSDSYTTNSDWHTWKYQSVTCRLNFIS